MNHISSMWAATSNFVKKRDMLREDIETDVVVMGGGYTGLAAAYYLREKGLDVVILEKHLIGWGASGRNAGILTPGYKNDFELMIKRLGKSNAQEMYAVSVRAIEMVVELIKKHNIKADLVHNGHLTAAAKPSHYKKLIEKQKYMKKNFNYETQLISNEEITNELKSDAYYGALLDMNAYMFHPLNYALGLGEVVESLGTIIYENSPVVKINEGKHKVTVKTSQGSVTAHHLIIATNGYTTKVTNKLRRSIISIGSYMLATEPLPTDLKEELFPTNRSVTDTNNMLNYFRFSEDNRFLFGGRVSFKKVNSSKKEAKIYQMLQKTMQGKFPELRDYPMEYGWGGLTGFTRDFYPQVGSLNNRVHYALGYSGRGASLSTFMGWLLSEIIYDKGRNKSIIEQLPLKKIPFYNVSSRFVGLAGNYFRLLDLIS